MPPDMPEIVQLPTGTGSCTSMYWRQTSTRQAAYHVRMLPRQPKLTKPGLFITGTDTGVGKTVMTCAIAAALREQTGQRVGVCKPYASGCRRDREGLVSEDAEALAHFSDCRQSLSVIHPIRYAAPLAPAVAAETVGQLGNNSHEGDLDELVRSLETLDNNNEFMLIEGVGGLLVPLDAANPKITVLDLALELGYPVAIVARAGLGTLNHTAMTVKILKEAGCKVAGIIVNGYVPDPSEALATAVKQSYASSEKQVEKTKSTQKKSATDASDISMQTNLRWLQRMNKCSLLATAPACSAEQVQPHKGKIPDAILDAVAMTFWPDVLASP